MARKKTSRKRKSSKRKTTHKKTRRHSKRRKTSGRHGKGHIPLPILEKRLGRLARVVAKRGGRAR